MIVTIHTKTIITNTNETIISVDNGLVDVLLAGTSVVFLILELTAGEGEVSASDMETLGVFGGENTTCACFSNTE
jgi:hypothetical protein